MPRRGELRLIDPQRQIQRPDRPNPRDRGQPPAHRIGLVLLHQFGLDRPQPYLNALGFPAQQRDRLLGRGGHRCLIGRGDLGLQLFEALLAERRDGPISAAWPRTALTSWVRCRTKSSRTDNSMAAACCSTDLIGTLPIEGCAAATAIASASLRSFLPRLTNGLTYCGGISPPRWPSPPSARPQGCRPPP